MPHWGTSLSQLFDCCVLHIHRKPTMCFMFHVTLSTMSWSSLARVTMWTALCVAAWRKRSVSYFNALCEWDTTSALTTFWYYQNFFIIINAFFVSLPFNRDWKSGSAASNMHKRWRRGWKKGPKSSSEGHFTATLPLEVKSIQIIGNWIKHDTV